MKAGPVTLGQTLQEEFIEVKCQEVQLQDDEFSWMITVMSEEIIMSN
ncbi:MAG: hypothetical protein CM15mP102_11070 [Flavobacteriales bacterium]|nr:MAG: hypothetical protein CM15mP102_11070 [Flavobacteriales bacterium]